MMRARAKLLIAVACLSCGQAAAAGEGSDARAREELRRICQELIDAIAPGHAEVWRKYLDERVLHVDEGGTVRNKEELLKELTPLPPGLIGSSQIDKFNAEIHGNVAVVAYETQEHLDYHGQIVRSRFRLSDTWLRTPNGWRLLGEQIAAVLKDPPATKLTQEQLCAYQGTYALTDEIRTTIRCTAEGLSFERAGRPASAWLPEVIDVFFAPGQPRTRRIFERTGGVISGFVDRREGEDIRWNKVVPQPR